MTVQFVVEDGTGKSTATSYATVAQYRQYWENRGVDYSATAQSLIETKLNTATEYIDTTYTFDGTPLLTTQSLEWPRTDVLTGYDEPVSNASVPQRVIDATCYLAAQDGLQFVDDGIASISYGPISKTFSRPGGQKQFPVADKLLKEFILQGSRIMRVN